MLAGIFKNVMFMLDKFGRNILNRVVYVVRKHIISTWEIFIQFLLGDGVFINDGFQVLHIRLTLAFTFGTLTDRFFRGRFQLGTFRMIKKIFGFIQSFGCIGKKRKLKVINL